MLHLVLRCLCYRRCPGPIHKTAATCHQQATRWQCNWGGGGGGGGGSCRYDARQLTSAQKLASDSERQAPWKPSEGLPRRPMRLKTLLVTPPSFWWVDMAAAGPQSAALPLAAAAAAAAGLRVAG